jgi:hypothetical protein
MHIPLQTEITRDSTWVGSVLTQNIRQDLKCFRGAKYSSSFTQKVNDNKKCFVTLTSHVNVIKRLFVIFKDPNMLKLFVSGKPFQPSIIREY